MLADRRVRAPGGDLGRPFWGVDVGNYNPLRTAVENARRIVKGRRVRTDHRGDARCMGSHADLRCRVQDHGVWGDWSAELEDDGFLDIQLRFRHGGQTTLKMLIFSQAC